MVVLPSSSASVGRRGSRGPVPSVWPIHFGASLASVDSGCTISVNSSFIAGNSVPSVRPFSSVKVVLVRPAHSSFSRSSTGGVGLVSGTVSSTCFVPV